MLAFATIVLLQLHTVAMTILLVEEIQCYIPVFAVALFIVLFGLEAEFGQ